MKKIAKIRGRFLALMVSLLFCTPAASAFGQRMAQAMEFPEPAGYVNDFANVLSREARQNIARICAEVKAKTGAEIAVVTLASLDGQNEVEYGVRLFEAWQIGEAGKDNGVLMLLAVDERRIRIEVGYGLEGDLPDITAGQILTEFVVPKLSRSDWDGGLLAGTEAIAHLVARANGVELSQTYTSIGRRLEGNDDTGPPVFVILFLILFFVLPLLFRRGRAGSSRRLPPVWHHGQFGGGFRHGGFGGMSGRGFGGFGGGSSGGGGASRSF